MSKTINSRKVVVSDLTIGMYVARLDIPWAKTDYPLQGFYLDKQSDIIKLRELCKYVVIDVKKTFKRQLQSSSAPESNDNLIRRQPSELRRNWQQQCTEEYVSIPAQEEIRDAVKLVNRGHQLLSELIQDHQTMNQQSLRKVQSLGIMIAKSVIRNSDALVWLSRVYRHRQPIFDHGMRMAIWAAVIAKQLGMQEAKIYSVTQTCILTSVGKAGLSKAALASFNGLDMTDAFARYSDITLERLRSVKLMPSITTTLQYATNREQNAVGKLRAPLSSQIVALAESFEWLTSPLLDTPPLTVQQAFARLYSYRDKLCDAAIIESLIAAIGMFPAGTSVVLSNGECGFVVEQNSKYRLRARVALFDPSLPASEDYDNPIRLVQMGTGDYAGERIVQQTTQVELDKATINAVNHAILVARTPKVSALGRAWQSAKQWLIRRSEKFAWEF